MRLKPGAKIFLVIVALVLIGAGAWKLGWLQPAIDVIAPERKPAGQVDPGDFSFGNQNQGNQAGNTGQVDTGGSKPVNQQATPATGGKLNRPIRVGIVLYGGFTGGLIANNGKAANANCLYAKQYGIQVEFVQIDDLGEMANAFLLGGDQGGLDMMATTADMFAMQYPQLKSIEPKTVLQTDWSRGADAIAAVKGINSVSDLKGKKVAVCEASPSHFLLLYVLSQAGMSANDIKPVFTASSVEAAGLFKAGSVDACVSWSPDVYIAADSRPGATILASTREATSLLAGTIVARGDFCNAHPDELTKFVHGWFDGVDQAGKDPDKAGQVLASSFEGITLDDAMGMLGDVKLQDAAGNRDFFGLAGETVAGYDDLYTAANKIWSKVGLLKDPMRAEMTRNTGFVAEATKDIPAEEIVPAAQEFEFAKPTEEVKQQEPIVTKRISVYFETASYTLDPNAKLVLEQAAELAQTFGSTYMRVSGNTDSVGSRQMNQELSRKRAQAVVDFLVSKYGFPRDKFIVVGNGPDKPVASNDTEAGRAENRRTDFEVLPPEQ